MEIIRHNYNTPNVGTIERAASVAAGAWLAWHGLKQKSWSGLGLAFLGTGFIRRGVTGFCYTYQALGIRTADDGQGRNISVPYELGIRVDQAITINRPRAEVFRFWRNLENLAEFMEHVESVRDKGDNRSHWVAKGPANRRVEWDAEVINEIDGELIGWRSLGGSDIANAGSVRFSDAEGGRGTEVRVSLQYNPPGGTVGAFVAKIFGEEPSSQIRKDLQRLKMKMESGVVPTTAGQPAGVRKEETEQQQNRTETVSTASEESFPASDAPAYTH